MDLFFFLLSLLSLCGVSLQQNCCPTADYTLHVTANVAICIRMFTSSASFEDALAVCQQVTRGSLLKLDPLSELENIIQLGASRYWIGLRRRDGDLYRWTADDTTPSVFNWVENRGDHDCVQINGNAQGRWDTASCAGASLNYICQAEVNCAVSECLAAVTQPRCPCEIGFVKQNNSCTDVDECSGNPCTGSNMQCVNLPGSYECTCDDGYSIKSGDTTCTLNNECTDDASCTGDNTVCVQSFDSRHICQCATGYAGSPCTNIDECSCDSPIAQCVDGQKCVGANEVCMDMIGSFSCNCAPGHTRLPNNICVDIDECSDGTTCRGARQTCTNMAGSYNCTCDAGYSLENDVCVESCSGRCDSDTEACTQAPGESPVCGCRVGFVRLAGVCRDVNECAGIPSVCGSTIANLICVNTPGSYVCECSSGFSMTENGMCEDVNECTNDAHNCRTAAECINTVGSFTCDCRVGEILINDQCRVLRGFRVRISASNLNNTAETYDPSRNQIYEYHFCKTILDILEVAYPNIPHDCSPLRFESGSVIGYLLVRMLSPTIRADAIENTLETNVVSDKTLGQLLYSSDRTLSMAIDNPAADIDVQDTALYSGDACNPSPCQNGAPCVSDRDVFDVACVCSTGFSGHLCEIGATGAVTVAPNLTTSAPSDIDQTLIIIIIIVAVIIVLLIVGVCCCCCCFFLLRGGGGFGGAPGGAPPYGVPAAYGPGVAPIEGPPTIAGYGGQGGYYDANSVI